MTEGWHDKLNVIRTAHSETKHIFFCSAEETKMVPLQRSDSIESTQSEREFRKKFQAITHRMVHRKSSAVMYSRILERTFGMMKQPWRAFLYPKQQFLSI